MLHAGVVQQFSFLQSIGVYIGTGGPTYASLLSDLQMFCMHADNHRNSPFSLQIPDFECCLFSCYTYM